MFNSKEVRFDGDYFFKEKALGTAALTSDAIELGGTLGGIRVRAYVEGTLTCSSGNTVKVTLETADAVDGAYTVLAENTVTATGTTITGDLFSFVPDNGAAYMRVKVTNSASVTGNITVAPELIP